MLLVSRRFGWVYGCVYGYLGQQHDEEGGVHAADVLVVDGVHRHLPVVVEGGGLGGGVRGGYEEGV